MQDWHLCVFVRLAAAAVHHRTKEETRIQFCGFQALANDARNAVLQARLQFRKMSQESA